VAISVQGSARRLVLNHHALEVGNGGGKEAFGVLGAQILRRIFTCRHIIKLLLNSGEKGIVYGAELRCAEVV
jgi:hypothetical protein